MTDEKQKLPFSQRDGLAPIPPQLKTGQVSAELRRLLWTAVYDDLRPARKFGADSSFYAGSWEQILRTVHVRFLRRMPDEFKNSGYEQEQLLKSIFENGVLGSLFDFVELLIRHPALRPQ